VDQNTTIALKQTTTEVLVEFFQDDATPTAPGAQCCGAAYFITRFPKKFRVTTAHLNAAVEGTEFMVTMSREGTELAVLEGVVLSQTTATREERPVTAGNKLVAGQGAAAAFSTLIKPTDAVQWVLHYPPLSDAKTVTDLPTEERCHALPSPSSQDCLTGRAELLLRLGQIEEALRNIDSVLALDSGNGDANALRAIIQITKNDKSAAAESAMAATAAAPDNYRAWLAQSYSEQASFELDQALGSARKAQALQANSSLANTRVAELLLSLGRTADAEVSARAAVDGNPAESGAHTMLGFIHLAQIDIKQAHADFQAAIERDSFSPLPRLGLGLAMIRGGKLVEGREQLEIAVVLDPSNSLLRSYVGKAYYEENTKERNALGAAQFDLAKQFDPRDPTPWFYDAILQQTENRPVEALHGLQTSIEKNDSRVVYRSRLLVDDDAAARTASAAAIYGNLGFEKLVILESTKAISQSAGNNSAHRLLAIAYADLPRHDVARVSEALQAQIRQPVSNAPVPPLLSAGNLAILRDTGPSQLGANEFNQLFNRDGVRFEFDGIAGGRDTLGEQLLVSALADDVSATFSQLHYETEGFTSNDAAQKDIYDLFLQKQIAWNSSIQLDLKRTEFEIEETFFRFDPDNQLPVNISEEGDSFRLSGHQGTGADNDWIWSAIYENRYRLVQFLPDEISITDTDGDAFAGEIQHTNAWGAFRTVSGAGYIDDERDFQIEQVIVRSSAGNAYVYGQWRSPDDHLSIHAGLAADWYRRKHSDRANSVTRERVSPKFGLVWSPRIGSTIRLAAFSSIRRPFVGNQTIEPTQLAGFNQFFSGFEQLYGDVEGTISRRAGIAFDQTLSRNVYAGIEVAKRKLDVPSINLARDFGWRESTGFAYLYKTFPSFATEGAFAGWSAVAALEGEYEDIDRPQILTGSEGIMDLETVRVPISLRFFNDHSLSLRLRTTYVKQSGTFSVDVGFQTVEKEDSAWISEAAIDYRLPRRRGVITVGVTNITDDFIDLVETDPFNPRVATRRFAFLKLRLSM
jgi:tetratricopeptide (TPR) repeat protein